MAASVRPSHVLCWLGSECATWSAKTSAFSAALWTLARSPPRDWQSARAADHDLGVDWYVKAGPGELEDGRGKSRTERTESQPGTGRDSHERPHTNTLLWYVYFVPEPPSPVATSTPQPSDTRIKSRPVHEPTLIHVLAEVDDHSSPQ